MNTAHLVRAGRYFGRSFDLQCR